MTTRGPDSALLAALLERLSDREAGGKRLPIDQALQAGGDNPEGGPAQQTLGTGFVRGPADPFNPNAASPADTAGQATAGSQPAKTDAPAPVEGGSFDPNVERWRPLVSEFFAPEDVDKALYVIKRESSGNPTVKNPNSSATGLFQHLARLWPGRAQQYGIGGADILDPRAATYAAAKLVYEGGGWSHWAAVYDYDIPGGGRNAHFISGLPYEFSRGGAQGWQVPAFNR